jgi:hypothetical protein
VTSLDYISWLQSRGTWPADKEWNTLRAMVIVDLEQEAHGKELAFAQLPPVDEIDA